MLLFAVHISDGYLHPLALGTGFSIAVVLVAISTWKLHEDEIPRIGVMTAAFFVASLIHLPLGITSAHLLLNGLMGVVLGIRAAIAIAVGLFLQAFLFQHGGLTTLGVNIAIYAIPAMLTGFTFRPVRRLKWLPDFALGCVFGALTATLTVVLNYIVLLTAGQEDWRTLANLVFVAHLPIIAVEAIGVGFTVQYLGKVKPEWVGGSEIIR